MATKYLYLKFKSYFNLEDIKEIYDVINSKGNKKSNLIINAYEVYKNGEHIPDHALSIVNNINMLKYIVDKYDIAEGDIDKVRELLEQVDFEEKQIEKKNDDGRLTISFDMDIPLQKALYKEIYDLKDNIYRVFRVADIVRFYLYQGYNQDYIEAKSEELLKSLAAFYSASETESTLKDITKVLSTPYNRSFFPGYSEIEANVKEYRRKKTASKGKTDIDGTPIGNKVKTINELSEALSLMVKQPYLTLKSISQQTGVSENMLVQLHKRIDKVSSDSAANLFFDIIFNEDEKKELFLDYAWSNVKLTDVVADIIDTSATLQERADFFVASLVAIRMIEKSKMHYGEIAEYTNLPTDYLKHIKKIAGATRQYDIVITKLFATLFDEEEKGQYLKNSEEFSAPKLHKIALRLIEDNRQQKRIMEYTGLSNKDIQKIKKDI